MRPMTQLIQRVNLVAFNAHQPGNGRPGGQGPRLHQWEKILLRIQSQDQDSERPAGRAHRTNQVQLRPDQIYIMP